MSKVHENTFLRDIISFLGRKLPRDFTNITPSIPPRRFGEGIKASR